MKRLQFGTSKCVKLHVGKTCIESMCKDLYVGGWKVEAVTDTVTGKCSRVESFEGFEKMGVKEEQLYLGDIVSMDGRPDKNFQARKNKGLGIINQIMDILKSVFFGKIPFLRLPLSSGPAYFIFYSSEFGSLGELFRKKYPIFGPNR